LSSAEVEILAGTLLFVLFPRGDHLHRNVMPSKLGRAVGEALIEGWAIIVR
jgi:hypothetical protein